MQSTDGTTASVTEIELSVTDASYPFVGVSGREDCRLEHVAIYPANGASRTYFRVDGAEPERVVADLESVGVTVGLLQATGSECLISMVAEDTTACPGAMLATIGALLPEFGAAHGEGRIRAYVPPAESASVIVDTFRDRHPTIEVVAKRQCTEPVWLGALDRRSDFVEACMTDRQYEVLATAYAAGYFDRPRRRSGEEIAAELGISQPTFSQHLRTAQDKLFDTLLADADLDRWTSR